jgi:imidazolonepropionase-like amidohydrolase
VDELDTAGVDGVTAVLETGAGSTLLNRIGVSVLDAVVREAHSRNLPVVIHTGDSRDVAEALQAGADGIEHGSLRDLVPEELFVEMARKGVAYVPSLSVAEAYSHLGAGKTELLERSLVLQVGPAQLVEDTKRALQSPKSAQFWQRLKTIPVDLDRGMENLRRAHQAGVMLVTGSDAGSVLVLHGPAVHRELQLWEKAEIPPGVALQAATYDAARLLGVEDRVGLVRKGHDADLLIVDGNPLQDITITERISAVIFKGERLNRIGLFEQE